MSLHSGSPLFDSSSRPCSITRSSRENFVAVLESLPSESTDYDYELNEEVLDIEDFSENESDANEIIVSPDDMIKPKETDEEMIKGDISDQDPTSEKAVSPTETLSVDNAKQKGESRLDDKEIDPRIRKGLKKIKKLDQILNDKVEREMEVKRSRRALEEEFQMQVARLFKKEGAGNIMGSQQLLRLCASSDRKDYVENNEVIGSIFSTQIDSEYYQEKSEENTSETVRGSNLRNVNSSDRKSKKDFLKRNIELAGRAQEIVQLTNEEKKRLDELLADDSDLLMVDNPFTTPCIVTSGYQFTNEEQRSLLQINAQLKDLVPAEDFSLSICDSQSIEDGESDCKSASVNEVFIRESKCGEGVLQEGQEERIITNRLRDIEEKLSQLHVEEEEVECIDPDLLRKLLDIDSRLTSAAVSICDSLRTKSSLFGDVDVATEVDLDLNEERDIFVS